LRGVEPSIAATRAVERARSLLIPAPRAELADGLRGLQTSALLVDRGEIRRRAWGARFVHYEIPRSSPGPPRGTCRASARRCTRAACSGRTRGRGSIASGWR